MTTRRRHNQRASAGIARDDQILSPMQLLDQVPPEEYVPLELALKIAEDCKTLLHADEGDYSPQHSAALASASAIDAITTLRALCRRLATDVANFEASLPPLTVTVIRSTRSLSPQSQQQQQALLAQLVAAGKSSNGNASQQAKNGWRDSSTERSSSAGEAESVRAAAAAAAVAAAAASTSLDDAHSVASSSDPFPRNPNSAGTDNNSNSYSTSRHGEPGKKPKHQQQRHPELSEKQRVLALCLNNFACALYCVGDRQGASATLAQAVALEREATAQHGKAALSTMANLIAVLNAKGDVERAAQIGCDAMRVVEELQAKERNESKQRNDDECDSDRERASSNSDDDGDDNLSLASSSLSSVAPSSGRSSSNTNTRRQKLVKAKSATASSSSLRSSSYHVAALRYNYAVALLAGLLRAFDGATSPALLERVLDEADERGLCAASREALRLLRRARGDCVRVVRKLKMERAYAAAAADTEQQQQQQQQQHRDARAMTAEERACRNLVKRIDASIAELVRHAERLQDVRAEIERRQQLAEEDVGDADEDDAAAALEVTSTPRRRELPKRANKRTTKPTARHANADQPLASRFPPIRGASVRNKSASPSATRAANAASPLVYPSGRRPHAETGREWLERIEHEVDPNANNDDGGGQSAQLQRHHGADDILRRYRETMLHGAPSPVRYNNNHAAASPAARHPGRFALPSAASPEFRV